MRAREGWADVAKGICIIAVVLWHVVTKHAVEVPGTGTVTEVWATVNAQLLPLRMPLFFLISGMFAVGVVGAPSGARWRRRAANLAIVYVIWVVIQTFVLALTPEFDTARATNGWELLAQLTISPTNLWFLLALAVYLAIARFTRHLPSAVVLPTAFVIAAAAGSGVLPDLGNAWQVAQNLFFFLAGLRLRAFVERFAATSALPRAFMLAAAYAGALAVVGVLGMRQWPGVWPVLAVIAVAFGISLCAVIDRRAAFVARPLRWVGRRTLPIYVMHMIPLALIDGALRARGWHASPVAEVIGPPVLTVAVIAICLAVHAVMVRMGGARLFSPLAPRRAATVAPA